MSSEPERAWAELGRFATLTRAEEQALVLQAVGIRFAIARMDDDAGAGHALIVQTEDADRAREQLRRFATENRGWPPQPVVVPPMTSGVGAALVYAALLIIAFIAQQQSSWGIDWVRVGNADAALMRSGEWWRAITALGLHGDGVHLAGNLLFGALFGVMLAQSVGAGSAWLVFVLAGAAGNMVNAWWQAPSHSAIGASTGVFGLLGAQAAIDWMRRGRVRLHPLRRWAPIIMGVALLAWFGGSGDRDLGAPRVDIAAHVFGFVAGLVCGVPLATSRATWLRTLRAQSALVSLTLVAIGIAWALAVRGR